MRYILLFWALPMGTFWSWYYLSLNDIKFGYLFLSRVVHDFAFRMYGNMLGIEPEIIPALVARACVVDTLLIFSIYAFRKRRQIIAYVQDMRARYAGPRDEESALSRSSAP